MAENETVAQEGGTQEGAGQAQEEAAATSAINEVVEAVIADINTRTWFAAMTRGALPTAGGLTCEVGPTSFSAMHMDKRLVVPLDLTLNGKSASLREVTDAMNGIHAYLGFKTTYPHDTSSADRWQIIDITTQTMPQIIGREQNGDWLMASSLTVKFYWKGE